MTSVTIPESIPCQFDARGWAPCKKPSDNGWCAIHEGLKCVSCGDKAIGSCDVGMGGLCCGAPLCATCEHSSSEVHITKEAAEENRRKANEEVEARIASRTNPERRMNQELGVPLTLFELLKKDWRAEGYQIKKVYYLELKHGLMGFFPAIFCADKEIVFTTDLSILEKVWKSLPPKYATLREHVAYVDEIRGIAYLDAQPAERETQEPFKLLTNDWLNTLVDTEDKPFKWAFGLIGAQDIREDTFFENLSAQAYKLDPTFASTTISTV